MTRDPVEKAGAGRFSLIGTFVIFFLCLVGLTLRGGKATYCFMSLLRADGSHQPENFEKWQRLFDFSPLFGAT